MKTLLVLSVLLCAALAAPAGDEQKPLETVVELPQEDAALEAAQPEPEPEDEAVPELQFNFCPNFWQPHESLCFKLISITKSWHEAEEYCNNLGGHLASVTNSMQYNFLQGMALNYHQSVAWLGGFYLQDRWMWIDRKSFHYTNWYSQATPSSYPCMYLRSNTGWSNTNCNGKYAFICVKNPFGC
ncbi:ladderlectin-like [Melanotaenia boesemani]|uniref:ladderlectin-like n=1 Tax=Melanotaenia boesemani TaxID=1250792 RepID=UPI001C047507|nr:ladderlectin-like [Melanotaenia boesemani]